MAATCVRAHDDVRRSAADATAIRLADVFCRQARHKVERLFAGIRSNSDAVAYSLARDSARRALRLARAGHHRRARSAARGAREGSRSRGDLIRASPARM
jgi:hypothetical protein